MAAAGTKLQTDPNLSVFSSFSPNSNSHSARRLLRMRGLFFVLADLCGFSIVAFCMIGVRFESSVASHLNPPAAVAPHIWFTLLYATLVVLFSHVYGLYSPYQSASWRPELIAILKSVALATMLVTATIYVSGAKDISRFVIGSIGALSFFTMAAWRKLRRTSMTRAIADGLSCHNVLIIGTDLLAENLRDHLVKERQLGFVVLGLLATDSRDSLPGTSHCIGTIDDLPRLCRTQFVDEIILCAQPRQVVKSVITRARDFGVGVRVVPDLYDGMAWGARLDYLGSFPTLGIVHREVRTVELKLKRLLDISVAAVALVVLSPLLLIIAILIKVDSRGPVFYSSQRVGRKGRVFACYKFRTMVSNAEALKAKLQHLNERDGVLFKIRKDPRITPVGRFLRKYSLDELAQLWNVLKGDMSLVGPRPPLASEMKHYELDHYRRLEAAPGITGLWQVEARTSPSFADYIALDLRYVEQWSFHLDIKILFKTVGVVLAGTGS